jgi:peroxiredoxin
VAVWLVNSEDSVDDVERFLRGADVTLPNLFDTTGSWYRSYDRRSTDGSYAPYPLQVLVDQDGRIQYIATQYDAGAMRDRIDALLAE